jgi:hypothetical protein
VAQFYLQALGSFSSPTTTGMATLEVSEPASTRGALSESESESELLYDWRFTANKFVLAPNPLRLKDRIFSSFEHCGLSPYIAFSLTRGWVCHLQLLLAFAAHPFSAPSPVGIATIFYSLRFKISSWRRTD